MERYFRIKTIPCLLLAFQLTAGGLALPANAPAEEPAKTVREVQADDGTVEIWELVGVFGSEDEALQTAGLQKQKKKKIKKGKTKLKVKSVSYVWKKAEEPKTVEQAAEQDSKKRLKKRRSRRLRDLQDKTIPYNQIYIQDNLGSGR